MLGIEPRASYMRGMCFITERFPNPQILENFRNFLKKAKQKIACTLERIFLLHYKQLSATYSRILSVMVPASMDHLRKYKAKVAKATASIGQGGA